MRKKTLSSSQHGHNSTASRDSTFVELHDVNVVGVKERAVSVDSTRGEGGGAKSIPSPLQGGVVGTVSERQSSMARAVAKSCMAFHGSLPEARADTKIS